MQVTLYHLHGAFEEYYTTEEAAWKAYEESIDPFRSVQVIKFSPTPENLAKILTEHVELWMLTDALGEDLFCDDLQLPNLQE